MMAASSTGKFPCDYSTVIHEMSRACELTRQLRSIVLPLLSTDPLSEMAGDLFEDILRSFSVVLNKRRPCSHSDVREESDGRKKRRKLNSWTTLTTVPHDDGYQWRKYGQKKINNSKFPRSYYKCAHHGEQVCRATKTAQQKDGNDVPPKFTVTFSSKHTCKINIVETSSPFVMNSSSNYNEESSAAILESDSGLKQKEDPSLSSSVGEFKMDEMVLSGPATPAYTPQMKDEIPIMLSPMIQWDLGADWTTIDELSHFYGLYDL